MLLSSMRSSLRASSPSHCMRGGSMSSANVHSSMVTIGRESAAKRPCFSQSARSASMAGLCASSLCSAASARRRSRSFEDMFITVTS